MSDAPKFIQISVYFNGEVLQKTSFPIREIFIGRSNDCDIVLDNAGVSRHHAKIALQSDQIEVTDLESGNGTFVNNQAIQNALLRVGDTLRIAKFTIAAELSDNPVENPQGQSQSNDVVEQNAHQTVFLRPEERQQILKHTSNYVKPTQSYTPHSSGKNSRKNTPWGFFVGGIAVGLLVFWLISLF